jgi:hypothetical protein
LIIGHVLSILISDLITPVIVPFSVDYSKAVLVVRDELAIYHNPLMVLFDVLVVVLSILVDLHPVAILIVLYRIVGIILD